MEFIFNNWFICTEPADSFLYWSGHGRLYRPVSIRSGCDWFLALRKGLISKGEGQVSSLIDMYDRSFPVKSLSSSCQLYTYWSTRRCSSSTKNSFWFTLVGLVHTCEKPALLIIFWILIVHCRVKGPCLEYPNQWLLWANIWLAIPSFWSIGEFFLVHHSKLN